MHARRGLDLLIINFRLELQAYDRFPPSYFPQIHVSASRTPDAQLRMGCRRLFTGGRNLDGGPFGRLHRDATSWRGARKASISLGSRASLGQPSASHPRIASSTPSLSAL